MLRLRASAYVFDFNGLTRQETAKLTSSDVVATDRFGEGPLGITEEVALIGALNYTDEENQDGMVFSHAVPEPGAGVLAALGTLILLKWSADAVRMKRVRVKDLEPALVISRLSRSA